VNGERIGKALCSESKVVLDNNEPKLYRSGADLNGLRCLGFFGLVLTFCSCR